MPIRGAEDSERDSGGRTMRRLLPVVVRRVRRFVSMSIGTSLSRRILVLNIAGLAALVSGILYLNQFRAGLIDARVESLLTQGEIMAGAIAASASAVSNSITIDPERLLQMQAGGEMTAPTDSESLDFPINPERVAPLLRRLITPTKTRARIYDRDGILILDSRFLYSRGQVLRFNLPPPKPQPPSLIEQVINAITYRLRRFDLPVYRELGGGNGRGYPEVEQALSGSPGTVVRVNEAGEMIVSVAVPVQRFGVVVGSLLLSTEGGDIDAIVTAERWGIFRVFLVAAAVTATLSFLLAGTIARPLRRLAAAADRIRRGVKQREEIPSFDREDEIGDLARAFRDMTNALYSRMDATESFAADVAHELKNPLTSLRSAVETLPLAKSDQSRGRLLDIIQHDVRRLDRLITDISDASRLDAELAREDATPIDVGRLVEGVVSLARETGRHQEIGVDLRVERGDGDKPLMVLGHDSRLGQVFNNLIDNARSFSPEGGGVEVAVRRNGRMIEVIVDDHGPGIRAEKIERVFERFYTDRPEGEGFGNNSGLGLSISRQIVEAHRGTITAINRTDDAADPDRVTGARFVVSLPADLVA
ncbi:sensor histidine kinase [Pleomorphomonas koreensis]|uniref:sensor histidine kinase n=1 Tax=Pleomorphomonas koreensis TaxID=257440 RepID=UPI0003FE2EC8|nr:sensor histidine kinase [Pleomorphomonas koreensis]